MLEEAGVDAIDVSSGSTVHSPDWIVAPPRGANLPLAHAIKNAVRIPVIAGGGLDDPETAERVIADGQADFMSLGKALIADPHLPRKWREGRLDDVRPCIRCMLCTDPRMRDNTGVRCAINPRAGRDADYPVRTVAAPKRIAVVGGGPAGLQAAIVLAERGHRVDLYEKEATLGGHFRTKTGDEYPDLISYLERCLTQCGVIVHTATLIGADAAAVASADALVIATGSGQSDQDFAWTLRAQGRRVYVVGDRAQPNALLGPVIDAFETAFAID
jgi:NADPH-dependent 2,4-dienoyl-CoA reductase/sulfur reductase-like enzyme